jgi:hypothetical protein
MKSIRAKVTIGASAVALLGALSHPAAAKVAQEPSLECVQIDQNHWICSAPGECTLAAVHWQCSAIAYLEGSTLEMYSCQDGMNAQCIFGYH